MRVIGGKYKGLKLNSLPGMHTRPTLTRVKEDAFNILHNYFIYDHKKSLDIFGGSGALSIEAMSRGIEFAVINDYAHPALAVIRQNLAKTKASNYQTTNLDYQALLEYAHQQAWTFDLIFLDPPFANVNSYKIILTKLIQNKLLNRWAIIIAEAEDILSEEILKDFVLLKHKGYNKKNLYILRWEN